jgi:hypothetical protein
MSAFRYCAFFDTVSQHLSSARANGIKRGLVDGLRKLECDSAWEMIKDGRLDNSCMARMRNLTILKSGEFSVMSHPKLLQFCMAKMELLLQIWFHPRLY